MVSVRVCMCVYMVAVLKVSRLAEEERERVKFVSIVMWPVTKGLQVRDQC